LQRRKGIVKLVDCLMLERVVFGNGERLKQS